MSKMMLLARYHLSLLTQTAARLRDATYTGGEKKPRCIGLATKSHSEETPTVWPYMQDEGQQEVKDTGVWNCRRNE